MYRYQERPLASHEETYEWLFDDEMLPIHSCEHCIHASQDDSACECYGFVRNDCRQATGYRNFLLQEAFKFRTWLLDSQEIFWISGKAGAGKSCLMNFLLEHDTLAASLRKWADQEVTIAGFFFWSAGGDLESSHAGLLRSLLCQILQSQPRLLEQIVLDRKVSDIERPWTISRLNEILSKVLEHSADSKSFMFLIDGLDEFEGDVMELFGVLDILNSSPRIKLCVSSRPWNVFEKAYGSRATKSHLRLHEINRLDINAYIQERLAKDLEMQMNQDLNAQQRSDKLITAIIDKAEGVFLWVNLVVKSLRKALENSWTISEMLELVERTPAELEDLMKGIFDKIDPVHRQKAARTFLMLLQCEEHMDGMLHPLWLSISHSTELDAPRNDKAPLPQSSLDEMSNNAELLARKWCGDFVNVVRGDRLEDPGYIMEEQLGVKGSQNYIQFPHRTFRDFIIKQKENGGLAKLAGEDFCPAFGLCLTILEIIRCVHPAPALLCQSAITFLDTSTDIISSKKAALPDLLGSYNAVAQRLRGDLRHWTLGDEHFAKVVELIESVGDAVDENTGTVLFMAHMIYETYFDLFWLMFVSTAQHHNAKSAQLWLGVALGKSGYWGLTAGDVLKALPKLIELGADLNKRSMTRLRRGRSGSDTCSFFTASSVTTFLERVAR